MKRFVTILGLGALLLGVATLAAAAPAGRVVIAQGVDPTTLDPHNHQETPASVVAPASFGASAPAAVARSWDPPPAAPTRLILVRHGETTLTAARRYSGRGDAPLSDRGLVQALAVAARVGSLLAPASDAAPASDPAPVVVLSSPLVRCRRTAEILAAAVGGGSVRVKPDLVECDFGEWEGLTYAEVRQRWPDELAAWLASPSVAPPGGESFVEVSTRVRRVVTRILENHPGQRVVVVSHVSPIKLILRDALAAGDAFLHRCYLEPAGMSIVDTWPDGGVAVRTVNDTAHLAGVG